MELNRETGLVKLCRWVKCEVVRHALHNYRIVAILETCCNEHSVGRQYLIPVTLWTGEGEGSVSPP